MIDPGTYMVGDLSQDSKVQFISAENGYGVTSLVSEYTPNKRLVLKHAADTKEGGTQLRADEWTGGQESYELEEVDGATVLTVQFDVPDDLEVYFADIYPKVMDRIKYLAEQRNS